MSSQSANAIDPLYKRPNYIQRSKSVPSRASLLRSFHVITEKNTASNPKPCTDGLRIATFNVHFWTDLYEKPAFNRIIQDLKALDADVLCLQEVSFTPTKCHKLTYLQLLEQFKSLGYVHSCEVRTQPYLGGDFGNMIISKLPLSSTSSGLLDKGNGQVRRGYCSAHLDEYNLDICCVHLDVFDESGLTRQRQLTQVMKLMGGGRPNLIVCGDFNCTRACDYTADQLTHMMESDLVRGVQTDIKTLTYFPDNHYHTCFEHINTQAPSCTVWSCRVTDYIFVSQQFEREIQNCGVYYTINSDHYPIYMDLKSSEN